MALQGIKHDGLIMRVQTCLATRHAGDKRDSKYSSYSFLTSALDGVSGQRHAPAAIYSRERTPDTHWIGGWVGLRPSLDTEAREKSFASAGDRNLVVQSVVCLSYPTCFTMSVTFVPVF
jgi:hypothetical protein